jgi:hypothetical protein
MKVCDPMAGAILGRSQVRGDDAHQLVPLLDDEVEIDHTAQRRAERAVIGVAAARLCGRGCSLRTMLAPA